MAIYFGLAIVVFITISAFRQKRLVWAGEGIYWLNMAILGSLFIVSPAYVFVPIVIIPLSLKAIWSRWLHLRNDPRSWLTIPMILVVLFWFEGTITWVFVLGGYLLIEWLLLVRMGTAGYRRRGISSFGGSGWRVNWVNLLLISNLLLCLIYLIGIEWPEFIGLLPYCYVGIGLWGMLWYAGNPHAFETFVHEEKYTKSTLNTAERYRILQRIDELFGNEEFYANPDSSLRDLAKEVKASSHQVSQVLNESKGMTFFEMLAVHRVQYARRLLRDPAWDHYKIEEIGEQVGYLSKSAFNTTFKKITGFTPSAYRKQDVRPDKVERLDHQEITENLHPLDTFGYIKYLVVMLSNFFKIYLRSLWRNKTFSIINIAGLVIGLTSSLLIYIYVRHELSYDTFHTHADDIYRIALFSDNPQTRTPHPLGQAMVQDFAQVEAAVSLSPMYGPGLTLQSIYLRNPENEVMFAEPNGFNVDSTFFDVFDFELIRGDRHNALRKVGGVVITESIAQRYFGDSDPMGKRLEAPSYDVSMEVTGVMKDPPSNAHFHPAFLRSYVTLKSQNPDDPWFAWTDAGHFNYVRLLPGSDPDEIEQAIPEWLGKYNILDERTLSLFQARVVYLGLQRITDIHLNSHIKWELEENSSIMYVYIMYAAIVFLLVIASINFINLSTARAFERAKEVGIRKTLGAAERAVAFQFISEALFTCFAALLVAYGLAALVFNGFRDLISRPVELIQLVEWDVLAAAVLIAGIVGILTGLYPALIVKGIKPSVILKGKFVSQGQGSVIRRGLVVIQFIVSVMMIFGSLIILQQVRYMEEKELGFNEEQTIFFRLHSSEQQRRIQAIKAELSNISGVRSVAAVSNVPGGQFNQNSIFVQENPENQVACSELRVDFDALQLMDVTLVEGRWFDRDISQDSSGASFIVNQAALRQLNLERPFETPVVWDEEWGHREGRIVGVVKDFHYKSLHESIRPIMVNIVPRLNYVLVRVDGANWETTLARIEEVHRQFDPLFEFSYSFLDERIGQLYDQERKALSILNVFTIIAVVLAALGLVGLSYLVITQRKREIGIRKVMGARNLDILWMENKSFLKAILVAVVVGVPVAWWIMSEWLSSFAYQVTISWLPVVMTSGLIVGVSLLSVSLAVMGTVLRNPGNALRYE